MWKAVAEPFMNIRRIFPTKQKYVREMIDVCKKDPNIRKIIIFGSAVTQGCNPWSDIDIYFEMKKKAAKYPVVKNPKAVFDPWSNFSAEEPLLSEIMDKGVVVYVRE